MRRHLWSLERLQHPGERQRPKPPRLVPLFPVGQFTPGSQCSHRGPIPAGSSHCCMICHQSGQDANPFVALTETEREQALAGNPPPDPLEST